MKDKRYLDIAIRLSSLYSKVSNITNSMLDKLDDESVLSSAKSYSDLSDSLERSANNIRRISEIASTEVDHERISAKTRC